MNAPDPNDPLSQTLAAWRLSPGRDANFRPRVWARIQQRARGSWSTYVRAHRVGWSVAATLAITVAGIAGHSAGRAKLQAERERMIVSYLGNLDPRVIVQLQP